MSQQKDLELLQWIADEQADDRVSELIKRYLPMVRHIIYRKNIPSNDFDDFFQEGTIALLKAIKLYDNRKYKAKFSTFAYLCIARKISNCFRNNQSSKMRALTGAISSESEGFQLADDGRNEPARQFEENYEFSQLKTVLQRLLSPLEYRVLLLTFHGYRQSEISKILQISTKAVDNAKTRVKAKICKYPPDNLLQMH